MIFQDPLRVAQPAHDASATSSPSRSHTFARGLARGRGAATRVAGAARAGRPAAEPWSTATRTSSPAASASASASPAP
ncbi:MAG: hypothetical protein MZV70_45620 [Desulfobacterales bacterium]|nr:hypothetical protein [Desulfobacterales bacterium]